jgi:hypothetical protein
MSGIEIRASFEHGHVFVVMTEGTFLVDTGAPASFGRVSSVTVEQKRFEVRAGYMGLTADRLSELVGRDVDGLLGTDILNEFDVLIDIPQSRVCFSAANLDCEGDRVPLSFVMTVPTLTAVIDATPTTMFFDTGAQLSYFQGRSLSRYPAEGSMSDFYPGFGPFSTDTFRTPFQLGRTQQNLRCGRLPNILGMTLMLAGTEGIVGNELVSGRRVGYFPRRQLLVLGESSN